MIPKLKNIIMWALTYRCNMSCEYCFQKNVIKRWDELSDEDCIAVAHSIANSQGWKPDAIWLTGGEPTVKKSLPQLIRILEAGSVACVVTTNGMFSEVTLNQLIEAEPRGINVSLESFDNDINDESRGNTKKIIDSLRIIANKKSSKTILGISCVISPKAIPNLILFAKQLKAIGVDYLSMNPLIGSGNCYKRCDFEDLKKACEVISHDIGLKIASDFYYALIEDCHLKTGKFYLNCPTGDAYFFVAPWGSVYPCSNEMWLNQESGISLDDVCTLDSVMVQLREKYATDELSTLSGCYGDRCIGCWKLYYDTIFT